MDQKERQPQERQPRLTAVRADAHRHRLSQRRAESFRTHLDRSVLDGAYRYATLILDDPLDAEDAVHDAALSAWTHWDELRDLERFHAWFGRILVNACRDRLRARRRAALRTIPADDAGERQDGRATTLAPVHGDPGEELARRDLLTRALRQLPPDQREAIVLRYWADLTVEEIARRTTTRPGTVKSRLHRAMAAIRSQLEASEFPVVRPWTPPTEARPSPPGDPAPSRKDQTA